MWDSKAVQEKLGKGSIFDGNKLAWLVEIAIQICNALEPLR